MAEGLGGCFGALLECEIDRLCWIIFVESFMFCIIFMGSKFSFHLQNLFSLSLLHFSFLLSLKFFPSISPFPGWFTPPQLLSASLRSQLLC